MANRQFQQFRYSMEKAVVDLYMKVAIGAAGAPTISRAKGVTSITRNSSGKYTIVLQDNYYALLHVNGCTLTGGVTAAPGFNVFSEAVASGSLVVQFSDAAGAAVDPGNGEVVLLQLTLSNSGAL